MSDYPAPDLVEVIERELIDGGEPADFAPVVAMRVIAALRNAGLVIERDWQPISTAPRDGTPLLCCAREIGASTWIEANCWRCGHAKWENWPFRQPPTHWRWLPVQPADPERGS